MEPHSKRRPCPICEGYPELPPGKGVRCWGFISGDGQYAHCTREELAGSISQHPETQAYPHRLHGPCKCGQTHGEAEAGEVRQIGEARGAEIVATYDYTDENGKLLYQVVRKRPKTFRQRRPDGAGGWIWGLGELETTLYHLPEVTTAVAAGDTVWIAEGEKDVDNLRERGLVATCNSGGAGKFKAEFARHFQEANVVIVRDKDEAGTEHARKVFAILRGVAASIRVVEAAVGKDASDHLEHGLGVDAFTPVWPIEDLRKTNPVAWKRRVLRMSLEPGESFRAIEGSEAIAKREEPRWPTGLEGEPSILPNFRGVVIIGGLPSAGKSYLALASAGQAALSGEWDAIYLACEMAPRPMARRIQAYFGGVAPANFHHVDVGFGASIDTLVDWVEAHVSERKMVIVFDSLSSYADQAAHLDENDPHGIATLKRIVMWAINVRRATDGEIAFLLLSELNREGRVKGRFADHKADLAIAMTTDKNFAVRKRIEVVKGWEYQTGEVGDFLLDVDTARLRRQ